jgi:opacity protein-like surface antigen
MKKLLFTGVSLMVLSGAALAQGVGVYGVVGTGGLGVGLNLPVGPALGIRGELASLTESDTYTEDQITYKGDLKLKGNGVFLDFRPFTGAFRLVGGATFGGTSAALNAQATNGSVTIDGQRFDATGNSLRADIQYPSTMPYIGVGWGHGRHNEPGWTFALDLGVSIGKPDVKLTGSGGLLAQPGAAAAIAAEERKVQDDLNSAKVLPVVKFSVGYQF